MRKIKLALICTIGGHFEQLINLRNLYSQYDHFWITNKNKQTEDVLRKENKYFIQMAHFKEPWKYLLHIPFFIQVFLKEKPTHIISTGSGRTAFIPFLLSKIFNIKFIFIDTFSRVNGLSKLGRFIYIMGHPVYVQWRKEGLINTIYIGPVFENSKPTNDNTVSKDKIIFVSLGTRKEQFNRLLTYLEKLIDEGIINEKVVVQAGYTKYKSDKLEIFDFCSPEEIDAYILQSKYVITQESAGLATKCLKLNKKFIVVPRNYKYNELPAKSDMNEDLQYKLEDLGYTKVANNYEELKNSIQSLNEIKTGFEFDNKLAIEALKSVIEGK